MTGGGRDTQILFVLWGSAAFSTFKKKKKRGIQWILLLPVRSQDAASAPRPLTRARAFRKVG